MELGQVYRELEKHQGKFFALFEGRLVVADNEQKIYDKVGGKCMVKQVPPLKGHFAWRAQITQALDELSNAPAPKPPFEETIRPDENGLDVQVDSQGGGVFAKLRRLFGSKKTEGFKAEE
jgi:hypothetical protein